jgi:hypothetical protein
MAETELFSFHKRTFDPVDLLLLTLIAMLNRKNTYMSITKQERGNGAVMADSNILNVANQQPSKWRRCTPVVHTFHL